MLVVSGLWRNDLVERAPRLRFIQSISAGTDQFDRERLARAGIRLASAQGANERAVAEHAMALILALTRQLHLARDRQAGRVWRPMIGDRLQREDELDGKTLRDRRPRPHRHPARRPRARLRDARRRRAAAGGALARRRRGRRPVGPARRARGGGCRRPHLPADPRDRGSDRRGTPSRRSRLALLVNVARGRVVDEGALLEALRGGRLAGAGLDCFHEEPLPPGSPFWTLPNVIVTPHSAGETRRYETNVIDILIDNLRRLGEGGTALRNGIV